MVTVISKCNTFMPQNVTEIKNCGKNFLLKPTCYNVQAFIQALLPTAAFPKRFSFFTICLVQWLC